MKIGIISINMYSKGLNFACPLHNYAFQQFLSKNGIESTVISYKPIYFNNYDLRHPYDYYLKMCNNFASSGRNKTEIEEWKRITGLRDSWKELYNERERRYDKFQNFIDSNYIKTEECYDSDLLEIKDPGFDCYICCTDVIWKKEPNIGFDRGFFLASKAMENKWKISYAASRGVFFSENEEDENLFLHYVTDIDAISVREDSLKKYLDENVENEVTKVIDPVLLHDKEFYEKILVKPKEEHYLFLYYVMERANDTIDQAVKYARAHNLKIVEITDRPLKNGRLSEYDDIEVIYNYDMGIEEWLGYIKYADCVFTNSFHCCCFSILFEKQLFVGTRNGDKVTHILDMFGLGGRRINKESDIITTPLPEIDYTKVKPILKQKQKESAEFILSAIRRMETSKREIRDYDEWKQNLTYKVFYNSGIYPNTGKGTYEESAGEVKKLPTGSWEFWPKETMRNNGKSHFRKNKFHRKGYLPAGWRVRFKIDRRWFWYLEDGTYLPMDEYDKERDSAIKIFEEGELIPYIPVNKIGLVVAEAVWKEASLTSYDIVYDSGLKSLNLTDEIVENKMPVKHSKFDFVGWRIIVEEDGNKFWYLEDGTLQSVEYYNKNEDCERKIIENGEKLPYIPASYVDKLVLTGVWKCRIKYTIGGAFEHSGKGTYEDCVGQVKKSDDGVWEFYPKEMLDGEENIHFRNNQFSREGYCPDGWKIRLQTNEGWAWYLEDDTIVNINEYNPETYAPVKKFEENDVIPDFGGENSPFIIADAVWKKESNSIRIIYNSGLASESLSWKYDSSDGIVKKEGDFVQFIPTDLVSNHGQEKLLKNQFELPGYEFVGWKMRINDNGRWFWYLKNGMLKNVRDYQNGIDCEIYLLDDQQKIPYIPSNHASSAVLEGVWRTELLYFSGNETGVGKGTYDEKQGTIEKKADEMWAFRPKEISMCKVSEQFVKNRFCRQGYVSNGWRLKAKIDGQWNWYLNDDSLVPVDEYQEEKHANIKRFEEYDNVPKLLNKKVTLLSAESLWKEGTSTYKLIYNSGIRNRKIHYNYDESKGSIKVLNSGSVEYNLEDLISNDGNYRVLSNGFQYSGYKFLGWRMRIKDNQQWFWYMPDGSLKSQQDYLEKRDGKRCLLKDEDTIPYIPANEVSVVVLEGVWRVNPITWIARKIKKIRGQK